MRTNMNNIFIHWSISVTRVIYNMNICMFIYIYIHMFIILFCAPMDAMTSLSCGLHPWCHSYLPLWYVCWFVSEPNMKLMHVCKRTWKYVQVGLTKWKTTVNILDPRTGVWLLSYGNERWISMPFITLQDIKRVCNVA